MTALVLRGDARHLPLPDGSIDLIVTSPPYWALRSYTDAGEHYAGQIGSEATPAEYIATLIDCTREWIRVLKPSGSLFVNLGDVYYSGKGAPGRTTVDMKCEARTVRREGGNPLDGPSFGIGRKSLVGLPWRYALACIDELGLILRAEIIWSKPNGLPESVTDRVRRSHEQWFHLVRQPRYYAAVDEIREPHTAPDRIAGANAMRARNLSIPRTGVGTYEAPNPLGKLPGSVWSVPSEPLTVPAHLGVDHFAAYPTEWPKRLILGWSPPGICTACGEGRRPVGETRYRSATRYDSAHAGKPSTGRHGLPSWGGGGYPSSTTTITGYACACPDTSAPTRPAVIVDPFGGTGTTALVAHALGRTGISVDRSADYNRLAAWRITDRGQLAKVLEVAKPPAEVDGQAELFEVMV